MNVKRLAISIALSLVGATAWAAPISPGANVSVVYPSLEGTANFQIPEIRLDGLITAGTVETVRKLAGEIPKAGNQLVRAILVLHSQGGDLVAGIHLGRAARELGLSTMVGKPKGEYGQRVAGECLSACVMAFAGGVFRFSSEKDVLGVHRFDADIPRSTDLDVGQIMSAAISNHIIEMDISPLLLDRIVRAGPDSMNVLDNKDAIAMRLVNNGVLPPIWNIEGRSGIIYLKGEQTTQAGVGKLIFGCGRDRSISMSSLFAPGPIAKTILETTSSYGLIAGSKVQMVELDSPAEMQGNFIMSLFKPTPGQLGSLLNGQTIGFTYQASDKDTPIYGFRVQILENRELIQSFILHCSAS